MVFAFLVWNRVWFWQGTRSFISLVILTLRPLQVGHHHHHHYHHHHHQHHRHQQQQHNNNNIDIIIVIATITIMSLAPSLYNYIKAKSMPFEELTSHVSPLIHQYCLGRAMLLSRSHCVHHSALGQVWFDLCLAKEDSTACGVLLN